FRAVSLKVSLSSALIATVALLIIVVVVAVVVVGVVVIVAVVVVVIVGICRSASTVPGQMANPFAISASRPSQCSASYSAVAGFDCFQKYPQTFICSRQHHISSCPSVQWQIQLPPALFLAWLPLRYHESCRKYPQTFICSRQHHISSCPLVQWQIQLPPALFLAWLPLRYHESCRVLHRCTSQPCQTLRENTCRSSFSLKFSMAMPEQLPE
nr:hypothetical protein [Tanacetum cinerariifolium]